MITSTADPVAATVVAAFRRGLGLLLTAAAAAVLVIALVGPALVSGDPGRIVGQPYLGPEAGMLLGTDSSGRDVLARLLAGGRPLLLIPLVAVCLTAVIGTVLGMLAGYLGGIVDGAVSRLDGLLLAIPPILVLLVLLHSWGYHDITLIVVVITTSAPFVSRLARAATRQALHSGYVEQAVALGDGPAAVLIREILPNIVRPVLADAGTRLAIAITLTSSAGFLGFGPDQPNWGAMIRQNFEGIELTPWGVLAPALCLAFLTVSANLLMDRISRRIIR
ncbi:ABC transporter permease [Sphaerimonospora sp. CA-214678]|uniref:ABC transporter permease n=1 Tax=Sphaerimonospora sp. CA-214678 TaxID=3240029 RepID=UPI003D92CD75